MSRKDGDSPGVMAEKLTQPTGPLRGLKVIELASIGPGPHACMTLADLGADVIRIERLPAAGQHAVDSDVDIFNRGRPSVSIDLKRPEGVEAVLQLVEGAHVLVEGMRPGVAERLGVGPEVCRRANPSLVYARMTGWGQDGPWADMAGHDLNYIAVSGALFGLGQEPDRPQFPMNLLGDFGGGSMYLVVGILAAVIEARTSGLGQVVDAAIVDGTAHLNTVGSLFLGNGDGVTRRVSGLLDGGTPFYSLYETKDGRHMSVAAIEPQFFKTLVEMLELADRVPERDDPRNFAAIRRLFEDVFKQRTQAEWTEFFAGSDACVAPVLPLEEASGHPQLAARRVFVEHEGFAQPSPAPRFSRTPGGFTTAPDTVGQHTREALSAWGIADVDRLIESGAAFQASHS